MLNIVGESSGQEGPGCFGIGGGTLDAERFFPISCPYFAKVSAILREMIDFALRMRKNLSEKTKTMLHWMLCAPAAAESTVVSGNNLSKVRDHVTESVDPEERELAATFQTLPPECKLHVFSYLTAHEKGRAERVCTEWRDLIRTPLLWKCIDLTQLSLCCRCSTATCTNCRCYDAYKERTEQFLNYLADIAPNLKELRFAFDIVDSQDDWLRLLRNFLDSVNVRNLELAHLNWKETPVKPYPSESATWSSNNYNDLMYRHRRRQRHFINFFDYFTASATNLSTLVLPFDWSPSSIKYLGRLARLETLVLESYFVPQPFQQETLDDLVKAIPRVEHLDMSVCIGSGLGTIAYRLASKRLRTLDLSRCQGFSLEEVRLPSLIRFRTTSKAYTSPFLDSTSTASTAPCIYDVLRTGAPALKQIDDHVLRQDWRENIYDELNTVLRGACVCEAHKRV